MVCLFVCVWDCCLEIAVGLYNCNIMHETLKWLGKCLYEVYTLFCYFVVFLLFCCYFLVILLLLFSTEHITGSPSMHFVFYFWHVDQKKNSFTGFMILDTTLNTVDLSKLGKITQTFYSWKFWHAEELLLKFSHHKLHKTALMRIDFKVLID